MLFGLHYIVMDCVNHVCLEQRPEMIARIRLESETRSTSSWSTAVNNRNNGEVWCTDYSLKSVYCKIDITLTCQCDYTLLIFEWEQPLLKM